MKCEGVPFTTETGNTENTLEIKIPPYLYISAPSRLGVNAFRASPVNAFQHRHKLIT